MQHSLGQHCPRQGPAYAYIAPWRGVGCSGCGLDRSNSIHTRRLLLYRDGKGLVAEGTGALPMLPPLLPPLLSPWKRSCRIACKSIDDVSIHFICSFVRAVEGRGYLLAFRQTHCRPRPLVIAGLHWASQDIIGPRPHTPSCSQTTAQERMELGAQESSVVVDTV